MIKLNGLMEIYGYGKKYSKFIFSKVLKFYANGYYFLIYK
jgi:hypothetical protein